MSSFDTIDVGKYFCDIDGVRYPKDGVSIHYDENKYLDKYRDYKLFSKEYVGEEVLNQFLSYPNHSFTTSKQSRKPTKIRLLK